MQEIVTEDFYHNLSVEPDGQLKDYKIMDDVRRQLQDQEAPIDRTTEAIKIFHGPSSGSSQNIHEVTKALAGGDKRIKNIINYSAKELAQIQEALSKTENAIDLVNRGVTCNTMDTPFLRYFITECQSLHPDITNYILEHPEEFEYFQQISEQVGGTFFTIIADFNSIDPLFSLDCENLPYYNLRTSARMVRALFFKLFIPIYGTLEDAQSLLDCLFMRAMPVQENHAFFNPNYAKKGPKAHGNNYAMDVFHLDRAIAALNPVYAELFKIFGDRLRLLNHIFPIKILVNFEHKIYEVDVEGTIQKVDRLNRSIEKRIMSNNRSMGAEEEDFNKEADSKNKEKEK